MSGHFVVPRWAQRAVDGGKIKECENLFSRLLCVWKTTEIYIRLRGEQEKREKSGRQWRRFPEKTIEAFSRDFFHFDIFVATNCIHSPTLSGPFQAWNSIMWWSCDANTLHGHGQLAVLLTHHDRACLLNRERMCSTYYPCLNKTNILEKNNALRTMGKRIGKELNYYLSNIFCNFWA